MRRRGHRALLVSLAFIGGSLPTLAWSGDSNRVYDSTCALCHQRDGAGLPGQFPRLAGRAGEIASTPAGRRYLINVVLFGLAGKVSVDGTPIIGVMPSFATSSDEDIASVLNFVASLGAKHGEKPAPPISAADVKAARASPALSPSQVREQRDAMRVAQVK